MKKLGTLLVLFSLSMVCFSGCGASEESPKKEDGTTETGGDTSTGGDDTSNEGDG